MARPNDRKRARRGASNFTTHNGNTISVKHGFKDRRRASKEAKARRKAIARSSLPNNFWLRQVHRMHPKRMAAYWFSRDGVVMALKIVGVTVIVCFVLLIGLFAYFRKDLPKINSLAGDKLGGSISYYDSTGKVLLWQDYGAVKRTPVKADQMSQYLKDATVAIEDQHFYHEGAFSFSGIVRAGLHDVFGFGSSEGLQGGSTITQQLVKLNEQWTDNRTVGRKIKELILAIDLNREYPKNEILAGYLNIAPYGSVEYGCESAAQDYFHTSCQNLSLAQSAFLAAIPQAPNYYSPYSDPRWNGAATVNDFAQNALITRKNYVLDQMVKLGMISASQAAAAKQVDVLSEVQPLTPKLSGIQNPYFVLSAKQELEQKYGAATVNRGGWKVITTLDLNIQNEANTLVQKNLSRLEGIGGDEEAMVIENVPTGQVVGLIGGVNFDNPDYGKINYASSVNIGPGSSIKPYVYTTLINNSNAGAGSVLYDNKGPVVDKSTGQGYPCTNPALPENGGNCLWDDTRNFPGPETIRYALAGSRNVPAVKADIQAGIKNVQKTATAMMNPNYKSGYLYNCYSDAGLTQVTSCGPSSGIGSGAYLTLTNHANGLATLGRMGASIPQTFILKITNASGQVVDQYHQPTPKQVINPQTAYIINNILSDPRATYFFGRDKIQHWNGWDFAIKTGTTNNNDNFLMTGYSTQYSVVSWAGYHTTTKTMAGGDAASDEITYALTAPMMEYLHQGKTPVNWQQPKGVQTLPAFVMYNGGPGGMLGANFPSPSTDLYPSWYKPNSGAGAPVTIDKVSGMRATSCTPDDAKVIVKNGNANSFSVDQFVNNGSSGVNYNLSGTDDVHNCGDTKPSVTLAVTDSSGNPVTTCDSQKGCILVATVQTGTHPLDSNQYSGNLIIQVNGGTVYNVDPTSCPAGSNPGQYVCSYSWTPNAAGQSTITAQVTDSVLYSYTSSPQTITTTVTTPAQTGTGNGGTNSGGNNGNGSGNSGGAGTGGGNPPTTP